MKINFLILMLGVALIFSQNVQAEENVELSEFGLDEEPIAEVVAEDIVETYETEQTDKNQPMHANVEVVIDAPAAIIEEQLKQSDEDSQIKMSSYIKELNLSAEQLAKAKEISNEGLLHQKQILQSIEKLQEQMKTLENKNLEEFSKILTPEQLEIFQKLRGVYDESLGTAPAE